jgi:hypothetical protein
MLNPDKQTDDFDSARLRRGMRRFETITAGSMPMKKYKIAVLDDYQNVALESADCIRVLSVRKYGNGTAKA